MAATPAKATPVVDTEPTNTPDKFSYKHATFDEVLEDLSSRFILNLPEDELAEVERVCFQVEQAHWYYEDFIREENPSFPSLPLKKFSEILFRSCPLLHHWSHDHETAFNGFMNYKTRVPVCGAIMLNESLTKCVLVKGWKSSAGWGFPKGKVNENEDEALCAVREVLEETGYNLSGQIRRTDCIQLCVKQQPITLFVVAGVPEDYPFKTQTRKEISKIDWFKLADLPTWKKNRSTTNKFYLITPVIGHLKTIVRNLRKTRKTIKPQICAIPEAVSLPEAQDEVEAEDAETTMNVESLVTTELEASSQSQSGEAEISSSQSSSIDPHTPSVNSDLGPHSASGDKLVFKQNYPDIDENGFTGQIGVTASDFNPDPRTHWSRLMTRLNHSEESSPQTTPQTATPTPPIPKTLPKLGSQPSNEPLPYQDLERAVKAPIDDRAVPQPLTISSSTPSVGSERLAAATSLSHRGRPTPSAPVSSADQLVKRTRQLQLLESVVAEDMSRRSPQLTPPMSAHTLGAYPRPSSVLIPNQVRAPPRSASVNPDLPRSQFTPYHHQHTHSVSSFPGVLPSQVSSSLQQHMFRPPHVPPSRSLAAGRGGRYVTPQLHPYPTSSSPLAPLPVGRNPSTELAHKGQMLSILSGGNNLSRPSTFATPASPSPHGSSSSTSTVTHAGPRGNSHLLSILNNTSPSRPANPQHARQLQGG